jgi:hypothetical protein
MSGNLVQELRSAAVADAAAAVAAEGSTAVHDLCVKLASRISGVSAAVVFAPPLGPITCCAYNEEGGTERICERSCDNDDDDDGSSPTQTPLLPRVVIWLLLDPTNIDSKQTTFIDCTGAGPKLNKENVMKLLYKAMTTMEVLVLNGKMLFQV